MQPIRVLLVEDNSGDALLLREMLIEAPSTRFELTHIERLGQALDRIREESFDLVLLDLSLPDAQGFDTFARTHAQAPHVPIIVLTGLDNEALAVRAVREGAQDYLVKGQVDGNLLARASRYAIERKRAELQIKASLREKEVLLQEIHHRVKNNLQIISSLLSLQSRRVQDPQTLEILRDSRSRVHSMALIHEQLYRSDNLARINFATYISGLGAYLFRSHDANRKSVVFKNRVQELFLEIDTAVPCGLILNELISNSLKHAFPNGRGGEICVELYQNGAGQLALSVADDGVGFPADLDFRQPSSLGLQLVNTLVRQLDGTIELERRQGTAFKLTLAASTQF